MSFVVQKSDHVQHSLVRVESTKSTCHLFSIVGTNSFHAFSYFNTLKINRKLNEISIARELCLATFIIYVMVHIVSGLKSMLMLICAGRDPIFWP